MKATKDHCYYCNVEIEDLLGIAGIYFCSEGCWEAYAGSDPEDE